MAKASKNAVFFDMLRIFALKAAEKVGTSSSPLSLGQNVPDFGKIFGKPIVAEKQAITSMPH